MYQSDCSTGENMTLGDDGRRYHIYVHDFFHLVWDGNEQPRDADLTTADPRVPIWCPSHAYLVYFWGYSISF